MATMHQALFRTRIIGTGGWAPPPVVTNDEMQKLVDTNDEWIVQRTGIKTRRLIDFEGQLGTSEMCEHASRHEARSARADDGHRCRHDVVSVSVRGLSSRQGAHQPPTLHVVMAAPHMGMRDPI